MPAVLKQLSTPALVNAIEANLFAFLPLWRRWPAAEIHDGPDLLWSLTGFPIPLFNSVMRANLAPGEAAAAIAAVIARGRSRDVPLLWWTGPATRPADLGERLTAGGFVHAEDVPGMAADLRDVPDGHSPAPGLVVEQVGDQKTLREWCATMCAGYEMPAAFGETYYDCVVSLGLGPQAAVRHYLGRLDGEPVATATVFVAAGVAGIYDVSTIPAARRRGIGAAMTAQALRGAREDGYRIAVLHSSAAGLPLYRRLGFSEYCSIGQYLWANEREGNG